MYGETDMKIVDKPWGRELWLVVTDRYAAKVLEINAGHRLSLQYHKVKHETLYLYEGKVKFTIENDAGEMADIIVTPGSEPVVVAPGHRHRMEAIENSKFFEVSTPELDDVVRLSDDYARKSED
jgi:mannose-6-phosphate isomerase